MSPAIFFEKKELRNRTTDPSWPLELQYPPGNKGAVCFAFSSSSMMSCACWGSARRDPVLSIEKTSRSMF